MRLRSCDPGRRRGAAGRDFETLGRDASRLLQAPKLERAAGALARGEEIGHQGIFQELTSLAARSSRDAERLYFLSFV